MSSCPFLGNKGKPCETFCHSTTLLRCLSIFRQIWPFRRKKWIFWASGLVNSSRHIFETANKIPLLSGMLLRSCPGSNHGIVEVPTLLFDNLTLSQWGGWFVISPCLPLFLVISGFSSRVGWHPTVITSDRQQDYFGKVPPQRQPSHSAEATQPTRSFQSRPLQSKWHFVETPNANSKMNIAKEMGFATKSHILSYKSWKNSIKTRH